MYQNIPTKVLTGEVRLSYVNLTTPVRSKAGIPNTASPC